jgi:DNA adenine methylase
MYAQEMIESEHVLMLKALVEHPGPVVLSGYANELYDEHLKEWKVIEVKPPKVEKGAARTEVLWVKPQ